MNPAALAVIVVAIVLLSELGLMIIYYIVNRSKRTHYDGELIIKETDEKITWTLSYDGDPYELPDRNSVNLKIRVEK